MKLFLGHRLMSQSICEGLCLEAAGVCVMTVRAVVMLSESQGGDQDLIVAEGGPRLWRRMVNCVLTFGGMRGTAKLTWRIWASAMLVLDVMSSLICVRLYLIGVELMMSEVVSM